MSTYIASNYLGGQRAVGRAQEGTTYVRGTWENEANKQIRFDSKVHSHITQCMLHKVCADYTNGNPSKSSCVQPLVMKHILEQEVLPSPS